MSDEEKKAIDYIKENIVLFLIIEQRLKDNGKEMEKCDKEKIDNYKTILNLIEKQSKEIECLNVIHESYKEMVKENNYISKDKLIELREIDNIDLIQCKLRKLLEE